MLTSSIGKDLKDGPVDLAVNTSRCGPGVSSRTIREDAEGPGLTLELLLPRAFAMGRGRHDVYRME